MNIKKYLEAMEAQGLFSGTKLKEKGAIQAQVLCPELTVEELTFLSDEVYLINEGYDGEPTSPDTHARHIKTLSDLKKKNGIPLMSEYRF